MASVLPYCIFLPNALEHPTAGVRGAAIRLLQEEGLAVAYSRVEPAELSQNGLQQTALEFHNVVHAIFARLAVIPFRFPTFLSEEQLRDHLKKESNSYLLFLRRHPDHVQMEIRVSLETMTGTRATTGTGYMTQRLAQRRSLVRASEELRRVLSDHLREWRIREQRDGMRLFAMIDRESISILRRLAKSVQLRDVRVRVSGPWPATEFLPPSANLDSEPNMTAAQEKSS